MGAAIARALQQARAAMAADVMKRLDRPIGSAHRHDAVGAQIERHVVTRLRDRADMADDLPARLEDALELEARHFGVAVGPGR
jgi:hypothetical protein